MNKRSHRQSVFRNRRRVTVVTSFLLVLSILVGTFLLWPFNMDPNSTFRVQVVSADGAMVAASPIESPGTNLARLGLEAGGDELVFDCLVDSVVALFVKTPGKGRSALCWLPLYPSDSTWFFPNRLSGEQPFFYLNGDLVFIDFTVWETKEKAISFVPHVMNTIRGIAITADDDLIPVLRQLKGAKLAVVCRSSGNNEMSGAFTKALAEVEPRHLFAEFPEVMHKPAFTPDSLRSLIITLEASEEELLSLEKSPAMRQLAHLVVLCRSGNPPLHGSTIQGVSGLHSLTIYAMDFKDVNAMAALSHLQILNLLCERHHELDPSKFTALRQLQQLVIACPSSTDFSFAARIPQLKTLGILGPSAEYDLTPLVGAHQLKCLSLLKYNKIQVDELPNVKRFRDVRPDVEIIEFVNPCLGSFWLVPMIAVACAAAWILRRRVMALSMAGHAR